MNKNKEIKTDKLSALEILIKWAKKGNPDNKQIFRVICTDKTIIIERTPLKKDEKSL
jgi:hypothetical protein